MGNMKEGMKLARGAAWSRFGVEYWRWFVFGPVVVRLVAIAGVIGVVALTGLYVVEHGHVWVAWGNSFFKAYMLPSILMAVGMIAYAAGAVIAWRAWGWIWKFRGFTAGKYTMAMSSIFIVFVAVLGVTL